MDHVIEYAENTFNKLERLSDRLLSSDNENILPERNINALIFRLNNQLVCLNKLIDSYMEVVTSQILYDAAEEAKEPEENKK